MFVTEPRLGQRFWAVSTAAAISASSGSIVSSLPEDLRRDRVGSRLLTMAEEEGRRRGCARVTLFTMEIQAPGILSESRAMRLAAPSRLRPTRRQPLSDDQAADARQSGAVTTAVSSRTFVGLPAATESQREFGPSAPDSVLDM